MAQNDLLKRYLEAGMALTQMTRAKAEAIVKDLVKSGEVQKEQTQERVEEIVDRSRRNTEQLVTLVRDEIRSQLSSLGFATKEDLARLEERLRGSGGGAEPPSTAGTAKVGADKAVGKEAVAKEAVAKKAVAKKAVAKKAAAKKAAGRATAGATSAGTSSATAAAAASAKQAEKKRKAAASKAAASAQDAVAAAPPAGSAARRASATGRGPAQGTAPTGPPGGG
jgi:polyhydroxyalkanoate synthesis regulator phasin